MNAQEVAALFLSTESPINYRTRMTGQPRTGESGELFWEVPPDSSRAELLSSADIFAWSCLKGRAEKDARIVTKSMKHTPQYYDSDTTDRHLRLVDIHQAPNKKWKGILWEVTVRSGRDLIQGHFSQLPDIAPVVRDRVHKALFSHRNSDDDLTRTVGKDRVNIYGTLNGPEIIHLLLQGRKTLYSEMRQKFPKRHLKDFPKQEWDDTALSIHFLAAVPEGAAIEVAATQILPADMSRRTGPHVYYLRSCETLQPIAYLSSGDPDEARDAINAQVNMNLDRLYLPPSDPRYQRRFHDPFHARMWGHLTAPTLAQHSE